MNIICILAIFQAIFITSQQLPDYRLESKSGGRVPYYEGIYYAVTAEYNDYHLVSDRRAIQTLDSKNQEHWWKFKDEKHIINLLNSTFDIVKFDEKYFMLPNCDMGWYLYVDHNYPITVNGVSGYKTFCGDYRTNKDVPKWKIEEMSVYKLFGNMTEFEFEIPLENVIKEQIKKVSLLETSTISNPSRAKLSQTLSNTVTKKQSFQLSFSHSVSESTHKFFSMSIQGSVGLKYFGLGGEVSTNTNFGWDWNRNESNSQSVTTQTTNEAKYSISKTVVVPPYSSVKVLSYANWIENLSVPYKAKLTVKGVGPVFENNGKLSLHLIEVLLSKTGFSDKLLHYTDDSVTFETHGQFTGSFGLDSVFSVTAINKTQFTEYETITRGVKDMYNENIIN